MDIAYQEYLREYRRKYHADIKSGVRIPKKHKKVRKSKLTRLRRIKT